MHPYEQHYAPGPPRPPDLPLSEIPHNGSPSRSGLGSLVFCTSSRTSFDNPPIQRPLSSLRQIPSKWPVRATLSPGYPISNYCYKNIFFPSTIHTDGVWFGNADLTSFFVQSPRTHRSTTTARRLTVTGAYNTVSFSFDFDGYFARGRMEICDVGAWMLRGSVYLLKKMIPSSHDLHTLYLSICKSHDTDNRSLISSFQPTVSRSLRPTVTLRSRVSTPSSAATTDTLSTVPRRPWYVEPFSSIRNLERNCSIAERTSG